MISSELANKLSEYDKISVNTASQQVSRFKGARKISGFFKSNQSFIYLDKHAEDGLVRKTLSEAMFSNGIKYWYTLNALSLHGGMLSQKSLECYTNYPILPLKSHIPFHKVMQKFVQADILVYSKDEYLFSPKFHNVPSSGFYSKTIENIKAHVLGDFNTLLRNTGIISYDTGEIMAEYGKYRWSFKGVSPIIGLRHSNGNFGYVLADILIGKPIFQDDVLFFISKVKQIQSFKNAPKLLPFIIVDDIHPDALNALKKEGIVIGFIKELFGPKYAEILKELIAIFNNAGASLKANPEKYLELIDELRKYNSGLLNNIRGTLFEYLVGHITYSGESEPPIPV